MGVLRKITLKFGTEGREEKLSFSPGDLTLFVGPNNSGKSLAMQEINELLSEEIRPETCILEHLELELPEEETLRRQILDCVIQDYTAVLGKKFGIPGLEEVIDEVPEHLRDRIIGTVDRLTAFRTETKDVMKYINIAMVAVQLYLMEKLDIEKSVAAFAGDLEEHFTGDLLPLLDNPEPVIEVVRRMLTKFQEVELTQGMEDAITHFIQLGVIRLDGYRHALKDKTTLLTGFDRYLASLPSDEEPDYRRKSKNLFSNLLQEKDALSRLRQVVFDAFGFFVSVDVTHPPKIGLRLSRVNPEGLEGTLSKESLEYFENARELQEFSDGVKSFVGMLVGVLNEDFRIMLVDEPEAFLHPPLVRRLGREVHELARARKGHVFAATHSPDFVVGCLQAGKDVNIIRLTYRDEMPAARQLPPDKLQSMMKDPLLRSAGVLSALFHNGAVVGEADADRAFYQEVNERLLAQGDGIDASIFLNAQNKQTIKRIVGPLRSMGIPAAAVVDLDIIKDENVLKELLEACNVGEGASQILTTAKGQLYAAFKQAAEKDVLGKPHSKKTEASSDNETRSNVEKAIKERASMLLKEHGLRALSRKQQRDFDNLFIKGLANYGVFVVPVGELECWLSDLKIEYDKNERKPEWLARVFARMGSDPQDQFYVTPSEGDVWAFMRSIASWIRDPSRQGMPS